MPRRARGSWVLPSTASISTTCPVTSADGGSMTSPKSQNGSRLGKALVLSASKAAQAPFFDCMPRVQRTPRSMASSTRARSGWATRRRARATSAVSSMSG
ncbi:hypothetical protein SALBM135S_04303 [Streptomyces alboniger]